MNDADIEMAQLCAQANHEARLKKLGICTHGWTRTPPNEGGKTICLDCGKVFVSEAECWEERKERLI